MTAGRSARTFDGVEYAPGRVFVVQQEGLRLHGWVAVTGGASGWGYSLHVGDRITCLGYGPGMGSDPGYGIEWTSERVEEVHAFHCYVWPEVGGAWAYRPPTGSVTPAVEAPH